MTDQRCGHTDRNIAFVDETGRGGLHGLAAAIACQCRVASDRKFVRSLVRPGQRRVHFVNEQKRRRKELLAAFATHTRVRAIFVTATGRPVEARSECWRLLVPELVNLGVGDLRIERMDGSEDRDRRDIRAALATKDLVGRVIYRHENPAAEPLLWVADAVAWSANAGEPWRSLLRGLLLDR